MCADAWVVGMIDWRDFIPVPDAALAQADFARQFRRDSLGHRLHVILGVVASVGVAGPTSIAEWLVLPVFTYSFIRVGNTYQTWLGVVLQPALLLCLAWIGWQLLTLAWSPDPAQGRAELGALRFLVLAWALWPVIDRRAWFIGAFAIGCLLGNLSQALQAVEQSLGAAWLPWSRQPDRISGWWDPVVGGSVLVAALGLHLAPALMGRGRARALAVGGSIATGVGIAATGTRGAWIAALALGVLVAGVAAWRVRPRRRLVRPALLGLLVLVAMGGLVALLAGRPIANRFTAAREELTGAIVRRRFDSDTGARLLITLSSILRRHDKELGIAGICGGGGVTTAMVIRRES